VSIFQYANRTCLPLLVVVLTITGCIRRVEKLTSMTTSGSGTTSSSGGFDELVVDEWPGNVVNPEPEEVAMVPLEIQLPDPAFRGTPVPLKEENMEKPLGHPRETRLVPQGTVNLALRKWVTASDPAPTRGALDNVTDGDKEASDSGCLALRPGLEWTQIDLEKKSVIYMLLMWHNHAEARVYRDVIVQVSDDPDFIEATTVFNNDYDGSAGLEIGTDKGYVETAEGKLIDCQGVEGRYVRLYSRGNHVDSKNHYTEVEIFGKPVE
jgi:hypothetical protein